MNLGQTLAQVRADPNLSSIEQERLLAFLLTTMQTKGPDADLGTVLSGLAGTATGFLLSRYLGLSPSGQAVASGLGLGLGALLHGGINFSKPRNVNAFGVLP